MIDLFNITPDDSECPDLTARLLRRDSALWGGSAETRRRVDNLLGWLHPAGFLDRHTGRIIDFANRIQGEGYQQVVLLGMGGSSLAPEVYAALFGGRPDALPLTVVDTTSPEHVANVTARCEDASTLFVVSSKSGTTAETSALNAHFFEWARARFDQPQRHFVAITDAGSPLESLAAERGYRETFLNPADIGGRFSALSFFGLVPAALAGADLEALRSHLPDTPGSRLALDACRLGAALGSLALEDRNKLTLHFSPALEPVAAWIEQLIDESTGKDGRGVVVIAGEPRFDPGAYSRDRFFVLVDLQADPVDDAWLDRLTGSGHPAARWRLPGLNHIGAEFYRWEIATALAGRHLGINPFDEPDVNASKETTRLILEQPDHAAPIPADPPSALGRLIDEAGPGDYIAILAYLPPTAGNRDRLRAWAARLTRRTGLPCCTGFGPRYLHSSGQLHKGGPAQGIFAVITRNADIDVPVPGQRHGFRSLFTAQAHGDLRVLAERGRRVVHLEVNGDDDIEALMESVPLPGEG